MPITFPGDNPFSEPSRQYSGGQAIGGVEKYQAVNGSTISVTNLNASNVSTGTLSADRIAAGAITADKIAANAVTADKINALAVTSGKIAASAVTADKISVSSLSAISANIGTITAGTIQGITFRVGGGYGGGAYFYGSAGSTYYDSSNNEVGIIYGTSQQFAIGANKDIYLVSNAAGGGGKTVLFNGNLDMNNLNIDACNNIYAYSFINRCEVADGIDPFLVMKTFEPEQAEKTKKKSWKKLDHNKLDRSIYKSTKIKKTKLDKVKKEIIDLGEELQEGYDLGKLVELQRQAILQLKDELDQLKAK